MKPELFMVFDVESIGLHGEGFAVGYVVVNRMGVEVTHASIACSTMMAVGSDDDRTWVSKNVPVFKPTIKCSNPLQVRQSFWNQWMCWKEKGAVLVADCAWPVEARFLIACVYDNLLERKWQGPYPLLDVSSFLMAAGIDPLQKFARLENELPIHDPVCDARQSARLLIQSITK